MYIHAVTWQTVHENIVVVLFALKRAHQRYLFISSKHHKSDVLLYIQIIELAAFIIKFWYTSSYL